MVSMARNETRDAEGGSASRLSRDGSYHAVIPEGATKV